MYFLTVRGETRMLSSYQQLIGDLFFTPHGVLDGDPANEALQLRRNPRYRRPAVCGEEDFQRGSRWTGAAKTSYEVATTLKKRVPESEPANSICDAATRALQS
jgi:hypothetical protein